MSAKYKSPSFLLPNEINTNTNPLNTDGDPATGTGINSLYSMSFPASTVDPITISGLTTTLKVLNTVTVSFWYYPTNFGGGDYMINTGTATSSGIFAIERFEAAIRARWKNSTGTLQFIKTAPNTGVGSVLDAVNKWYHICVVFDTTNSTATDKVQIWVNGVRNTTGDSSLTGSGFTSTPTSNDVILNDVSQKANKIDELAFFNKALTSTEIAALYGGTSPNIYPSNLMATNLNPIAYYPLGEQAQNTGYLDPNNPGSDISGSEWQFPNGVLQDYVMDFDGTSEYIDIPSSSSLVFGSEDFTISFWIKTADSTANILNPISSQGTGFFGLMIYQSKLRWNDQYNVSNLWVINNTQIVENTWINVVIIRNSGTFYVWYNNVPQTLTATSDSQNYNGDNGLRIGSGNLGDLNGQLSNLAIWNSNQTANIANIYNNGSPQTSYTVTPQNWWKLNADSVYTPSAPNYTNCIDLVQDNYREQIIVNTNGTNLTTWTVSMWAFGRSFNASHLWSASNNGYNLYWQSYQLKLWGTMVADSTVIPSSQDNKWGHYVVTREAGISKVYFNGKEIYSGTAGGNLFVNDLFIGGWNRYNYPTGNVGEIFNWGKPISNFGAWDSALTSSQVSTLFNFGTPETTPSFSPLHYFKLDNITTGLNNIGSSSENAVITPNSGNSGNGVISNDTNAVAVVPSWKIPSALTIPSINYTTALNFDGTTASQYITAGGTSGQTAFSFAGAGGNDNPFSISGWINLNSNTGGRFIGKSTLSVTGSTNKEWTSNTQNQASMFLYSGTNYIGRVGSTTLNTGEWIFITMTYNGDNSSTGITIYVNGQPETSYNNTYPGTNYTGMVQQSSDLLIGANYTGSAGGYFDGKMSNLAVFDYELTPAQVLTLYNNKQPESSISLSPIGWWKLDSTTITDSSGNGYTGANNGTTQVTSDVYTGNIPVNGVSTTLPSTALQQSDLQFDSPYSNYSLSFDGASGGFIDCGTDSVNGALSLQGNFTISLWFNTPAFIPAPNTQYVLSRVDAATKGWRIQFDGTSISLRGYDGTNSSKIEITKPSVNVWHHLVFTYDGGTYPTCYLDGLPAPGESQGFQDWDVLTMPTDAYNFRIGNGAASNYYIGKIDETAIWGTSLTSAQVLEIYNNGRPKDLTTFSGTAPSSWWRLGENAYFVNNDITLPNSISGAPNGVSSGTATSMLSADAPGTYANGVGTNLDIVDRVGDAALSVANSQSYNMIPDDKIPYVPGYVGDQISNTYSMTFDGVDDYFDTSNIDLGINSTLSMWFKPDANPPTDYALIGEGSYGFKYLISRQGVGFYIWIGSGTAAGTDYINYGPTITSNIIDGAWNFLSLVKKGGTVVVYLKNSNGEFSVSNTSSAWATKSMEFDRIGTRSMASPTIFFKGQIDEVAGFSEALTADQIKFDLYEPSLPLSSNKTADIENNTNLPTPVAWYRMGD